MNNEESLRLRRQASALLARADRLEKQPRPKKVILLTRKILKVSTDTNLIKKIFGDTDVQSFSQIHLRVKGVMDVWTSTGRYWHSVTRAKGMYSTVADLIDIIEQGERASISKNEWLEMKRQNEFFKSL